jgi:hypothetical protein
MLSVRPNRLLDAGAQVTTILEWAPVPGRSARRRAATRRSDNERAT